MATGDNQWRRPSIRLSRPPSCSSISGWMMVHIILCTTDAIYLPSLPRSCCWLLVLGPERMAKHFLQCIIFCSSSSLHHGQGGRGGDAGHPLESPGKFIAQVGIIIYWKSIIIIIKFYSFQVFNWISGTGYPHHHILILAKVALGPSTERDL